MALVKVTQNLIDLSPDYVQRFHKISQRLDLKFVDNAVYRQQTERETDTGENMTFLAEVTMQHGAVLKIFPLVLGTTIITEHILSNRSEEDNSTTNHRVGSALQDKRTRR